MIALLLACAPQGAEGLDARLRGLDYPHEVHLFRARAQGQDLEMAYMDVAPRGEPRGIVVLMHGKNFSGAYWESTMQALVEDGYRVIAPDQVGFGKSSKPLGLQYSFHQLAGLTRELLDDRGVGRAIVVGHSMGGMLAVRFARSWPERTERLVLVNPIGLEDWQQVVPYRSVDAWTEREREQTPDDIRDYMRESYFAGEWREEYEPLLTIQAGWATGPDREHMAQISARTYDMIFTQPVLHELPSLQVPTLLVIGQRDRTALGKDAVPPEVAATLGEYPRLGREAAAAIPGAELVELEGVGHVPPFEAPAAWLEALLGFLP